MGPGAIPLRGVLDGGGGPHHWDAYRSRDRRTLLVSRGGRARVRLRNPFGRKTKEFPSHLWTQCPSCGEMLFNKQLDRNHNVCQKCGHHFKLGALARIDLLADSKSFSETDADMVSSDPLGFVDSKPYPERIAAARAKRGHKDAVLTGDAQISGIPVVLAVMDFEFMGGSMGSVVGEKITRAAERAFSERKPLVIVSASGGARMQEGTIALMQLAKTVAPAARRRAMGTCGSKPVSVQARRSPRRPGRRRGRRSSSRATSRARTPSTSSTASSSVFTSCTATARSATTRRSSAASPSSVGGRS